jgi:hypothetical protein
MLSWLSPCTMAIGERPPRRGLQRERMARFAAALGRLMGSHSCMKTAPSEPEMVPLREGEGMARGAGRSQGSDARPRSVATLGYYRVTPAGFGRLQI